MKTSACFTRGCFLKKMKKGVDKSKEVWYSVKAVCCGKSCGGEYKKEFEKIRKKYLTVRLRCVILIKLLRITNGSRVENL